MKFKKLLASVLCASTVLSFAACGNTETTTDAAVTTDPAVTTVTTSATTDTQTTTEQTTQTTKLQTDPSNPVFDASNIVLSFGSISDVHINATNKDGDEKFKSAILRLIAEAKKDDADGIDALAIAGDIADTGKISEVQTFANIVKTYFPNKNVMLTTGNHDVSGVDMQDYYDVMGEEYFANDTVDSDIASGSRHCIVNGYHFVFVEPQKYGSGCPYTQETIEWLDKTLENITKENPNAYVFVFTHPMIYKTCYGSELGGSWYTTYLTDTLSKYPQVMTFGGHLHFPINDERSIMQNKFTSLGCGSVRYLAIEGGYANASGTVPDNAYSVSSGLLVQVDKNGNCRITRMFFSQTTTFKEAWEVSVPVDDGSHLTKYTTARANDNKAPVLSGIVTFTPTSEGASDGKISIAAGTDDDFVHHYIIKIIDKPTGAVVGTYTVLSDFYLKANPSDMSDTFSWSIGSLSDGEYKVAVTAIDSWDAVSNEIYGEFKIGTGIVEELPSELPDTYADIDFADGKVEDTKGKLHMTLNNATVGDKELTFAGKTATVPALTVEARGEYAVARFKDYSADTITNFYNSETGFSVEGVFINRSPSGSQGAICGTQAGGWGIAQAEGVPYLFTYIAKGSSKITAQKASSTTEMTHAVATFKYDSATDKTTTALYLDGVLVARDTKTGKIAISTYPSATNAFVLGSDIDTNGMGQDFMMTDFSIIDAKLYAEALNRNQVQTAYNNAIENFG